MNVNSFGNGCWEPVCTPPLGKCIIFLSLIFILFLPQAGFIPRGSFYWKSAVLFLLEMENIKYGKTEGSKLHKRAGDGCGNFIGFTRRQIENSLALVLDKI